MTVFGQFLYYIGSRPMSSPLTLGLDVECNFFVFGPLYSRKTKRKKKKKELRGLRLTTLPDF